MLLWCIASCFPQQKTFTTAWEWRTFSKQMAQRRGRCDHDMHHSHAVLAFFLGMWPTPTPLSRFLGGTFLLMSQTPENQLWDWFFFCIKTSKTVSNWGRRQLLLFLNIWFQKVTTTFFFEIGFWTQNIPRSINPIFGSYFSNVGFIKKQKILSTLQQSGRHLLQHPWRPHSNALHSADEAPLQTAQLLCGSSCHLSRVT